MKKLIKAIEEFRQAFVIAVGDKSPFAKEALRRIDAAIEEASPIKQEVANGELTIAVLKWWDEHGNETTNDGGIPVFDEPPEFVIIASMISGKKDVKQAHSSTHVHEHDFSKDPYCSICGEAVF